MTKAALSLAAALLLLAGGTSAEDIRVLVWDERQPRQKEAYPDFLGNQIASHLTSRPGLSVTSVGQDDPEQGLKEAVLDETDVLIWWGHARQDEVSPETGREIVARIQAGQLDMIVLHSAHWATPFMEAMNERTRQVARRRFPGPGVEFEFVPPPGRIPPTYDSLVTPAFYSFQPRRGVQRVRVDLPNCVFPGVRADGEPSTVTVLAPDHPIAEGLPASFEITATEMYDEPFHVPEPDEVIFREDWKGGWFRGGMVWNLGEGKVFYFRPGHETYGVFFEEMPLRVLENAVRWLGAAAR